MQSAEINRRFLAFFENRGHTVVPSASLIADDPTLLLVNAGMVPFKPYFLGRADRRPGRARRASRSACAPPDIDVVGTTTRHAHVLPDGRQLLLRRLLQGRRHPAGLGAADHVASTDGGFGFDPRAALGDGLPRRRRGVRASGPRSSACRPSGSSAAARRTTTGHGRSRPGGPCSEIYFDRGPEYGKEGGPVADEDRYLEVWNLVFMQYELSARAQQGRLRHRSASCPRKNIDTGMGVERMAALLQGVDNIYETDLLRPILDRASRADRRDVRRGPRDRRPAAGHRRPHPHLDDADRRRRHARQRGPRLRPAPDAAPGRPQRCGCSAPRSRSMRELVAAGDRRDGADVPRAAPTTPTRIHAVAVAEEEAFRATLRTGTDAVRARGRRGDAAGGHDGARRRRRRSRCTTPTASRST